MKVYLDACCINRLTDDQSQPRVRQEADAIELIIGRVRTGIIQWISSEILADEIDRNPSPDRKAAASSLLSFASINIPVTRPIVTRAAHLEKLGYGGYDALHLACAEAARADVLLTTDDKFVARARRRLGSPRIAVDNPVSWSKEHLR